MKLFGNPGAVLLTKNIGRDLLKSGTGTEPHQGAREIARRLKQQRKAAVKANPK